MVVVVAALTAFDCLLDAAVNPVEAFLFAMIDREGYLYNRGWDRGALVLGLKCVGLSGSVSG